MWVRDSSERNRVILQYVNEYYYLHCHRAPTNLMSNWQRIQIRTMRYMWKRIRFYEADDQNVLLQHQAICIKSEGERERKWKPNDVKRSHWKMNEFTESMPHRIRIYLPVAAKHIGKYICSHISLQPVLERRMYRS